MIDGRRNSKLIGIILKLMWQIFDWKFKVLKRNEATKIQSIDQFRMKASKKKFEQQKQSK